MNRDGFKCVSCGKEGEGVTLNVHHSYYKKGAELWEYDARSLVTLCDSCHESRHILQQEILSSICLRTNEEIIGLFSISSEYPELMEVFYEMRENCDHVSSSSICAVLKAMMDTYNDGLFEGAFNQSTESSHEQ
jgi:hypothetical protein